MKKRIIMSLLTVLILAGCAGIKKWGFANHSKRYIELSISFNTEHYPWILGDKYPQMAVWIQSDTENYSTVFVTQGAGKNKWYFADERPSALPVWTGIHVKEKNTSIDAITGATPSGDIYTISWQVPDHLAGKTIAIFLEANVSFDYNEFYPKDAEENDPGYSDVNGQPSVVWKTSLALDHYEKSLTPFIAGHGHVLGKNHDIDTDVSHITTAAGLFSYINIQYYPGG